MYDQFIAVMKIEDYNNRLSEIKTLVQLLPKVHYDTLEYLIGHLLRVSAHSEENKMEPSNLAIVFGPSLIRDVEKDANDMQAMMGSMMNMGFQNSLIEAIINQTCWMFDGNPNK
jgi:D-serine dehydratase